jgi:multimeric flavodoxin WrbA/nitrite reductase/ring-hydroxylating ferredoxin subunit
MSESENPWHDLGAIEELRSKPLQSLNVGRLRLALSYADGRFGVISGVCNHAAGPLGEGHLDGEYVVCPWHYWKFHRQTGEGEPGYEADRVPSHELKEVDGHLWVKLEPSTRRNKLPHEPHPLSRKLTREDGPPRVLGISTTAMDPRHPRFSTSDFLLEEALGHARSALGCETRLLRLRELAFRACEGFYSKSAHACTWPCSITQMDKKDQMDQVYEGAVFWADVVLVATPIRWGNASALYYKMIERMNCVQNQVTIANKVLIRNKVASFLITGGQDNVQAVAGQMMMFFGELGFDFPQFPFIAHSRGWTAEDMERNIAVVQKSEELQAGARDLVTRAVEKAQLLLGHRAPAERTQRGGRKAQRFEGE